jgi:hypothetical protein
MKYEKIQKLKKPNKFKKSFTMHKGIIKDLLKNNSLTSDVSFSELVEKAIREENTVPM